MKTIGILALQGDSLEHFNTLKKLNNVKVVFIKKPEDLNQKLHGLIIPGGESTTIGKLLKKYKLDTAIKKKYKKNNIGIYGTCAGCILIAKEVDSEYSLKLIDIKVKRNAYGRQVESFISQLDSDISNVTGVFIRAPKILKTLHPEIKILATNKKDPVLIQQGNIMAGTFHPELTNKTHIHRYFVENCC